MVAVNGKGSPIVERNWLHKLELDLSSVFLENNTKTLAVVFSKRLRIIKGLVPIQTEKRPT